MPQEEGHSPHAPEAPDPEEEALSEPEATVGGRLPTIHEDDDEHNTDEYLIETFYAELISTDDITDDFRSTEGPPLQVQVLTENSVLFALQDEDYEVMLTDVDSQRADQYDEYDNTGEYIELCSTNDMAKTILSEQQFQNIDHDSEVATLRVYISQDVKKAVVIKEDDLMTKKEMWDHHVEVAEATISEIKK